jgi:hypothetical protein
VSIAVRLPDSSARKIWRGAEHSDCLGGSRIDYYDVLDEEGRLIEEQIRRKYTFGDMFCGAGGATQGADMAGLYLRCAVDFDKEAMTTYRGMFARKGLHTRHTDIHEFIKRYQGRDRFIVDILHLSPPCQPFSPANTTPNAVNDARKPRHVHGCRGSHPALQAPYRHPRGDPRAHPYEAPGVVSKAPFQLCRYWLQRAMENLAPGQLWSSSNQKAADIDRLRVRILFDAFALRAMD